MDPVSRHRILNGQWGGRSLHLSFSPLASWKTVNAAKNYSTPLCIENLQHKTKTLWLSVCVCVCECCWSAAKRARRGREEREEELNRTFSAVCHIWEGWLFGTALMWTSLRPVFEIDLDYFCFCYKWYFHTHMHTHAHSCIIFPLVEWQNEETEGQKRRAEGYGIPQELIWYFFSFFCYYSIFGY